MPKKPKFSVKVRDQARVLRRVEKNFGEINDLHVVVGVPMGTKARDDGDPATMAEVAFYNEFGTDDIPERSFLRSTIDENNQKYARLYEKLMGAVLENRTTVKKAMGQLAAKAKADVQAKIRSNIPPPNASSTLEKKKPKTKTLIDSGQLLQSITYEVRDGKPDGSEI